MDLLPGNVATVATILKIEFQLFNNIIYTCFETNCVMYHSKKKKKKKKKKRRKLCCIKKKEDKFL